jgi:hypothetical protein
LISILPYRIKKNWGRKRGVKIGKNSPLLSKLGGKKSPHQIMDM